MAAHYGGIVEYIWKRVSRFDFDKYWKMREYVVSHSGDVLSYYYLYRIKKMDAYNSVIRHTYRIHQCIF